MSAHRRKIFIPWKEREKIRHEINTFYKLYEGMPVIVHRSVGVDNKYYLYYVYNHGFDDYEFFDRWEDIDDEEDY